MNEALLRQYSGERLWRSLTNDKVHLRATSNGWGGKDQTGRFLWRHCPVRAYSCPGGNPPHEVYNESESCFFGSGLTMTGLELSC